MEGSMPNLNDFQTAQEFIEANNTATDEDREFFAEMDYFDDYKLAAGLKNSRWSIYGEGIKMGEKSPFEVGTVFRNKCTVWDYDVAGELKSDRWGDVWALCDKLIGASDDHHIFIEGFEKVGNEIHLVTGS
tara:strand:+ start:224 stop:616 length:393 start_codon:yes stop_codon:yes gene_type:complete